MKKNKKKNNLTNITPKSKLTNILRILWLRSRERAYTLKRDRYTCQICGAKQSKAKGQEVKVTVHHKYKKVDIDKVIETIREYLITDVDNLITLCEDCHKEIHQNEKTTVNVFNIIKSPEAMTIEEGNMIYNQIIKKLKNNDKIIIDFSNIKSITPTFLNIAIGQLYNEYDNAFLKENIKIKNLEKQNLVLLKKVINNAKKYFKKGE